MDNFLAHFAFGFAVGWLCGTIVIPFVVDVLGHPRRRGS